MGCRARDNITLLFILAIIIFICEETFANQLEVAKKYGKRFGNKNKSNTTSDTKETTKTLLTEPTKLPESVKIDPPETYTRHFTYTKSELTTPTTASVSENQNNAEVSTPADPEQEVDVDLSQLQVSLPNVRFDCSARQEGYYGDPDYKCEVFHYCNNEGKRDTFLCPSNSKFNQKDMTCDTDSGDELCQSEPAWGHNHLYPSSVQQTSGNTKEKNQFEVTAPKFETKENGFREPIYDLKSYDSSRKSHQIVKTNGENGDNSNGDQKSNNNNDENNKDIKVNYFGGNFGERQRNTLTNDNNRKNSNYNNNRNKTQTYNDLGRVSDANKKGIKEEKENNPVISHSIDSNQMKQSFTPTHYQKSISNSASNKPIDMTPIHNNNKVYEFSHTEHYIPSSPPEKSYLSPPMPPESPSSVAPHKIASLPRHKPYEYPNRQLAPTIASRPAIKWPNRKQANLETYLTQPIKTEISHPESPPPPPPPPPPQTIQHHQNPQIVYQSQQDKPQLVTQTPKLYEIPINIWPQNDNKDNYQTIVVNSEIPYQPLPPQRPKPKKRPVEDMPRPQWTSPDQQNSEPVQQQQQQQPLKRPVIKTWNSLELYQRNPEGENYFVNKNQEPVNQNSPQLNSNNWFSDMREKNSPLDYSLPVAPPKPKWAQDMFEIIEYQSSHPQQPIQQSSQAQKTTQEMPTNFEMDSKVKFNNKYNNKNHEKQIFSGHLNGGGYEMKDNTKESIPVNPVTNFFYEQYRPQKFFESPPTPYYEKSTVEKPVKHVYIDENGNNDNQFQYQIPLKSQYEDLKFITYDKPIKQSIKKLPGYVVDKLQTEFDPKIPLIKKLNKPFRNKSKPNYKFYKPKKQQFVNTANFVDDLLSNENAWTLKQFDSTGLDFSNPFPLMPLTARPKLPKKRFPTSLLTHYPHNGPPIRFPYQPQAQGSMLIPQQLPFHHNLQAQHTFPMQYYLPLYPITPQPNKQINQLGIRPSHTRLW